MIWLHRLSLFWLLAAACVSLGYWTNWIPYWQAGGYAGLVLLSSLLAFLTQGWDKWQSRGEHSRVPEKWLHLLELVGGWPGAHFGQQFFRHKTFKPSYRRIFYIVLTVHILLLLGFLYFSSSSSNTET